MGYVNSWVTMGTSHQIWGTFCGFFVEEKNFPVLNKLKRKFCFWQISCFSLQFLNILVSDFCSNPNFFKLITTWMQVSLLICNQSWCMPRFCRSDAGRLRFNTFLCSTRCVAHPSRGLEFMKRPIIPGGKYWIKLHCRGP